MTMADTNINIRTDSEIKAQAQKIFASLGLDMSTAINIFLRQTVQQNDIPLTITTKSKAKPDPREAGFGCMKGEIWVSDDFDEPLDELRETSRYKA
jgi:DNA-damage-inducible protein J